MIHTLVDKETNIVCTVDDTTKAGKKEYIEKSKSGNYDEVFYWPIG